MGLVTGTGLQNGSEVIDTIRSTLVAEGWTAARDTGTVGANNKEVWLHLPAASTFNGIDMLVGLRMVNADALRIQMSHLTPGDANVTGSPQNSFDRVLGTPNFRFGTNRAPTGNSGDTYEGQTLTSNVDNTGGTGNSWNQGSNYLRHWIFTPNASPVGDTEVYCYVVVEVATGVYRNIFFGEGKKLGGSGWTGGLFFGTTYFSTVNALRTEYGITGNYQRNQFADNNQGGWILNFNNTQIQSESPAIWCPWVQMGFPSTDGASAIGMGTQGMGLDFINRSPAPFSGQSIRVPCRFYQQTVIDGDGPPNLRPLIEAPDIFITNIQDLTPGDTVADATENFLVVPASAKTGSLSSGNLGFLIRSSLL